MSVPSFSAEGTGEELGLSARSYLRQVEAWTKVTRAPPAQRALLLYQSLSGRAWVEAEELRVADLAKDDGVDVFKRWVQERYQEIEVSKIADSLTSFFKRLRRQPGQSIREFNSLFDRAHTRLLEIDCRLPEVAKAWAYLNALGLAHNEELALLASVNNEYQTSKIQRAAILHEKSLKAPWSFRKTNNTSFDKNKVTRGAYLTELHEDDDGESEASYEEGMLSEEAAMEVHEAYMAHETAKARLREVTKNRGVDMDMAKIAGGDKSPDERLRLAKSRSFCAGCKRRGHWHRDPECPLNQGVNKGVEAKNKPVEPKPDKGVRDNFVVYVAFEVGEVGIREGLLGITDCACSRSVCGQEWMERYLALAKKTNVPYPFIGCKEEFRFGASKIFKATYAVLVVICLQGRTFVIKVAVVDGDVPLLLSRSVLGKLGMVYDIERHEADFKALGLTKYQLSLTNTGHPAIPVSPKRSPGLVFPSEEDWGTDEVRILSQAGGQYTAFMTSSVAEPSADARPVVHEHEAPCKTQQGSMYEIPEDTYEAPIFFSKKIDNVIKGMLLDGNFNHELFLAWWSQTQVRNDFWLEGPCTWTRVHVIPRRACFDPRKWKTPSATQREVLLEHLGRVRSTFSVSCHSHRPLDPLHHVWRESEESPAVLWIGKSIFAKRPPLLRAAPLADGQGDPEHMEPHQGGVDPVGLGGVDHMSQQLDGRGNQVPHSGEAVPREVNRPERAFINDLIQRRGSCPG